MLTTTLAITVSRPFTRICVPSRVCLLYIIVVFDYIYGMYFPLTLNCVRKCHASTVGTQASPSYIPSNMTFTRSILLFGPIGHLCALCVSLFLHLFKWTRMKYTNFSIKFHFITSNTHYERASQQKTLHTRHQRLWCAQCPSFIMPKWHRQTSSIP